MESSNYKKNWKNSWKLENSELTHSLHIPPRERQKQISQQELQP